MKKIGIPGWMVGENSFGVNVSYLDFIRPFGSTVILTPDDVVNPPKLDLLVLPGGADLLPLSYGAVPGYRTQKSNPILEHFDANMLPGYIRNNTPIFAICRGAQRLWAMYGGVIDQHNPWHEQSKHQYDQCHQLIFENKFKDYSKLIDKVTSRHHQCMDASIDTPQGLEVIAYAKNHGDVPFREVVEIFKHEELPIFGVQFHPEDHNATDNLSVQIIQNLLSI